MKRRAVRYLGQINWRKHILPKFHFLWAALKKFDDDNGFFLSSGVTFDLLICLIPHSIVAWPVGDLPLQ